MTSAAVVVILGALALPGILSGQLFFSDGKSREVPLALDSGPISVSSENSHEYDWSSNAELVRFHVRRQPQDIGVVELEVCIDAGLTNCSVALVPPIIDLWTGPLPSKGRLRLKALPDGQISRMTIDRAAGLLPILHPQGIVGADYRMWVKDDSDRVIELGRAVARIYFSDSLDRAWTCTGFLVFPKVLMTNAHCLHDGTEMSPPVVEFDYDSEDRVPISRHLTRCIVKDDRLDVAIFQLDAEMCDRSPLKLTSDRLSPGSPMVLIEHPDGEPKQVSKMQCHVTRSGVPGVTEDLTDFEHSCASKPGSSGSPMIDFDSGFVVGLHHFGEDKSGKALNQAVYMDLIIGIMPKQLPEKGECRK